MAQNSLSATRKFDISLQTGISFASLKSNDMNSIVLNKEFVAIDYTILIRAGKYFEECTFRNCSWLESDLSQMRFVECQFIDCDMSMSILNNTSFQSVVFTNCKAMGLKFEDCKSLLLEITFECCKLDFSSFVELKPRLLKFTECSLVCVDFTMTDLRNTELTSCNLTDAIFENTLLESANVTGSNGFVIDPNQNYIGGLKLDFKSLPGLLSKYNLKIEL